MNIDSECLTIELDQGSLGLAVKKLGGHLLVQEAGAVHALDSPDRDVAVAPGAGLGSARSRGGLRHGVISALGKSTVLIGTALAELTNTVDREDDQEQRNTDKQEVDAVHDEATHVLGHGTIILGLGGCRVLSFWGFALSWVKYDRGYWVRKLFGVACQE